MKRAKSGSVVIHSDGALAFKSAIQQHFRTLRHRAVAHKNMEFVRRIGPVRLPSGPSSSSTGTQAIDSTWKTLNNSIPDELHTKKGHDVNPLLEEYTWSWLYRVNHRSVDGFATLGGYMKNLK